ncbi:DUF2115 family protein [Methanolobus sediminis]|uniref:UPF0305 protein RE474_00030 n=1 Tax=Methanolobus sediminis TaxID=3072978 RepID=A0AA51UKV5_9EURY|nr:DUF2115 family protein [Methanolobus sediminis]WMW25142.1 DUF2115 family protein [Methanolobus sediminis]
MGRIICKAAREYLCTNGGFHINTCELLLLLKKEAANISSEYLARMNEKEAGDIQSPHGSLQYNIQCLARYNRKKYSELKERDCSEISKEIDIGKLEDFTFRINKYMDGYAPGQRDLKEYTRIISTYLTFIAKEPLHPPGMYVNENQTIFENNGAYYCPAKTKHILEEMSLCKYCVCRATD